jgi:hypothetical protein
MPRPTSKISQRDPDDLFATRMIRSSREQSSRRTLANVVRARARVSVPVSSRKKASSFSSKPRDVGARILEIWTHSAMTMSILLFLGRRFFLKIEHESPFATAIELPDRDVDPVLCDVGTLARIFTIIVSQFV